jgi:hypothetical protein
MRKTLFYLSILAIATVGFTSCDDEEGLPSNDPENTPSNNPDNGKTPAILPWIVGTWEGDSAEHHYPFVTFKSDSTYEWEYLGLHKMKDEGTYTFDSSRIVMKIKTIYEYEDGKYKPTSEYRKSDRVCKILNLKDGLLKVELNDYFMGGGSGGFDFILYKKDYEQNITKRDLQGTWESYESDGSLSERIIISDSTYTAYEVGMIDTVLWARKTVGTWSIDKTTLKIKPSSLFFSYEMGNGGYVYSEVDPETLETENWAEATYSLDDYTVRIYLAEDKKTLYALGTEFKKK